MSFFEPLITTTNVDEEYDFGSEYNVEKDCCLDTPLPEQWYHKLFGLDPGRDPGTQRITVTHLPTNVNNWVELYAKPVPKERVIRVKNTLDRDLQTVVSGVTVYERRLKENYNV